MTAGIKTGDTVNEIVAKEYSSKNSLYNVITYPHLDIKGHNDPSKYAPITLRQARDTTNDLLNKYDIIFKYWKKSGIHEGISYQHTNETLLDIQRHVHACTRGQWNW
jgi:hypothetical protein